MSSLGMIRESHGKDAYKLLDVSRYPDFVEVSPYRIFWILVLRERRHSPPESAHQELAALLKRMQGKLLLTHDDHTRIRELYQGFFCV